MFTGTQCDLWSRPVGTGHEKSKSREIPSTYFYTLIPSLHEHEASGGGHGRCLYCRLTSFSRSLQINLRINLDGTSFPAYRLSFFPRAQPVVASLYKTTEDRREQMPVLCCIAYQEFPICAGYPCALNSTIFCRKCSIFPFQSLSQGPHLRCDNRRDLFGRDLVQQ